jgi:hypothetical protein
MDIENLEIKKLSAIPFNLTERGLFYCRKNLNKLKEKINFHKSCIIQLQSDVDELQEILDNAGLNEEMISKYYEVNY